MALLSVAGWTLEKADGSSPFLWSLLSSPMWWLSSMSFASLSARETCNRKTGKKENLIPLKQHKSENLAYHPCQISVHRSDTLCGIRSSQYILINNCELLAWALLKQAHAEKSEESLETCLYILSTVLFSEMKRIFFSVFPSHNQSSYFLSAMLQVAPITRPRPWRPRERRWCSYPFWVYTSS